MRVRFLISSFLVFSAAGFVGAACGDDAGEGGGGDGAGPAILSCSLGKQECSVLCDPDLGCVECVGDGDCGAAAPACIHGHCVQCNDNTDCQMGQSCFPRNGSCQTSCTDNGDCEDNEPICDTMTGQCVGCMANTDCDGGSPFCDLQTKQCSECLSDGDCGTAQPNCDLSELECVQCAVDSDCADNEICEGHSCHLNCQSDVDCQGNPERPQCNEQTGQCVQCITDVECAAPTPRTRHR